MKEDNQTAIERIADIADEMGGEDQVRSFLAALFVVQYELAQQDRSLS